MKKWKLFSLTARTIKHYQFSLESHERERKEWLAMINELKLKGISLSKFFTNEV